MSATSSFGLPSLPFSAAGPERSLARSSRRMTASGSTSSGNTREREDAELIRRMAGGDKQACADLYDRLARPLYSVAIRILSDPAESQDIVQDVFLALWEKSGSFEANRGSAFAWAITLTRNRAIDRLRTRRRRSELLDESFPGDVAGGAGGSDEDSADRLVVKEKAGEVRAALATLPPEQVRTLEMAFFSGLTQQEIASRLNEPLGTVKARIRRGLLKLRDTLTRRHD